MEEWRTIKDFPNYEVSNFGNVRSVDRISARNGSPTRIKGNKLKHCIERNGYHFVTLYNGNRKKHKKISVHRLVAMAFVDNPNKLPYVNHKDETKGNNSTDNLEWCSAKYNSNYGTAIKRRVAHQDWNSIADKQSAPVICMTTDGELVKEYKSMSDATTDGYRVPGISKCCSGYLKTYKGLKWKYADGVSRINGYARKTNIGD